LKRGHQAYKCNHCGYRFTRQRTPKTDWSAVYLDWLHHRKTLHTITAEQKVTYPTLMRHFDALDWSEGLLVPAPAHPIHLLLDATFLGRDYGFLCFHDTHKIIWFKEIKTEGMKPLRDGLQEIKTAGYKIASVTIDGRKGYTEVIRKVFGNVPIQMCLFHQRAIVRRYITDRPKTLCGRELKALMNQLGTLSPEAFIEAFYLLKLKHKETLDALNNAGDYRHKKLRAAFYSLQTNLHAMFTYSDLSNMNIPKTTNQLEGYFGHLKERIKIHRGLSKEHKKKAIRAFLNSF
jgi:hypothetical protein